MSNRVFDWIVGLLLIGLVFALVLLVMIMGVAILGEFYVC